MSDSVQHRTLEPVVTTRGAKEVERLRQLTRLLDSSMHVPGTRYRFGLDALVGLVPGIGDAIGAIFSAVIVFQAARLGASKSTLTRMLGNVAIDTVVGGIPLLGDLFDAGYKANTRNMALLDAQLQRPVATTRASRRVLLLVGAGLLLLLAALIALIVLAIDVVVVRMG